MIHDTGCFVAINHPGGLTTPCPPYLLQKIGKKPHQVQLKFITKLNTASVATRYPDDLSKIQAAYTKEITKEMVENSKDVLVWFKRQF